MNIESQNYLALNGYSKSSAVLLRTDFLEISLGTASKYGEDDVGIIVIDFLDLQIFFKDVYNDNKLLDALLIAKEINDCTTLYDKCFAKLMSNVTPKILKDLLEDTKERAYSLGQLNKQDQMKAVLGF